PESRPTPFRRKGLDDDNDVDRVHSGEPSTDDLHTASSDVTFRTPLGSSWSPSDTSYLSIASPVGSRERRDGGVSPPVQMIRIDSLVGGDPVDTNADAEEETWLRKVNSNSRRLFSRHNNKSATEVKVMAARIDGLQREIRELRRELEESRTKILDMEERQEAFWQEDVYDIVNNISSVSSTPPSSASSPYRGKEDDASPKQQDVATETEDIPDGSESSSFYTAVSSGSDIEA
ncbi:hypothetical protein FOZ63_019323, partial [Perkinsus olseni]